MGVAQQQVIIEASDNLEQSSKNDSGKQNCAFVQQIQQDIVEAEQIPTGDQVVEEVKRDPRLIYPEDRDQN